MNATKRAQVPFGLRKKLMAATSMLLVAAIMLVSTSYAWFTLSTAPEITGITTSVGANGNLEIALLNSETYANPELITSNAGDSMDVSGKAVTEANITWGNLIDLDDPSYGLSAIKMYPSALNLSDGKLGASPLATPVYGADGRVTTVSGHNTLTASYTADNGIFDNQQGYGVRAVGISSTTTPLELTFSNAKGYVNRAYNTTHQATQSAVNANADVLVKLATSDSPAYTDADLEAMKGIAQGIQSSLNSIVSVYANAILATVAANGADDATVAALETEIAGVTNADELLEIIGTTNAGNYASVLEGLGDRQDAVAGAITTADAQIALGTIDADVVTNDIVSPLVGGRAGIKLLNDDGDDEDSALDEVSLTGVSGIGDLFGKVKYVCVSDGAVGTVATYAGAFKISEAMGIEVWGGDVSSTTAGELVTVNAAVQDLAPTFAEGVTNISDHYGYIVDFAFRTNAATSNLQLQTEAANRVYSDAAAGENGGELATMGGGSYGTFNYDGLTYEQGKNLLLSYRVVFFDPADNTVFATAMFDPATVTDEDTTEGAAKTITAKMKLSAVDTKYTVGQDAYEVATYAVKDSLTIDSTIITPADYYSGTDTTNHTLTVAEYTALKSFTVKSGETYVLGKDAYEPATYNAKAKVTVDGVEVTIDATNCNAYTAEGLTAAAYATLNAKTAKIESLSGAQSITSLPQNIAQRVSMLVYLDGSNIDNADVNANGTSGSLDLNVQFASDAQLTPMENSTLRGLEKESE